MCLAVPGRIISIEEEAPPYRAGRVDFGGVVKQANLSCVPEARVGDYVIVHVGFAISRVDPEEAAKIFRYLEEMDELQEVKG